MLSRTHSRQVLGLVKKGLEGFLLVRGYFESFSSRFEDGKLFVCCALGKGQEEAIKRFSLSKRRSVFPGCECIPQSILFHSPVSNGIKEWMRKIGSLPIHNPSLGFSLPIKRMLISMLDVDQMIFSGNTANSDGKV